jgi:hypothetical protein
MVRLKFETVSEMNAWMDKASDSVLRGKTCEVVFLHRPNCAHKDGHQRSSADQQCPCRPRPMLAYFAGPTR